MSSPSMEVAATVHKDGIDESDNDGGASPPLHPPDLHPVVLGSANPAQGGPAVAAAKRNSGSPRGELAKASAEVDTTRQNAQPPTEGAPGHLPEDARGPGAQGAQGPPARAAPDQPGQDPEQPPPHAQGQPPQDAPERPPPHAQGQPPQDAPERPPPHAQGQPPPDAQQQSPPKANGSPQRANGSPQRAQMQSIEERQNRNEHEEIDIIEEADPSQTRRARGRSVPWEVSLSPEARPPTCGSMLARLFSVLIENSRNPQDVVYSDDSRQPGQFTAASLLGFACLGLLFGWAVLLGWIFVILGRQVSHCFMCCKNRRT